MINNKMNRKQTVNSDRSQLIIVMVGAFLILLALSIQFYQLDYRSERSKLYELVSNCVGFSNGFDYNQISYEGFRVKGEELGNYTIDWNITVNDQDFKLFDRFNSSRFNSENGFEIRILKNNSIRILMSNGSL